VHLQSGALASDASVAAECWCDGDDVEDCAWCAVIGSRCGIGASLHTNAVLVVLEESSSIVSQLNFAELAAASAASYC